MVGAAVIAGTVSLGIFGQNIGISMVLLAFVLQRPCWQWVFRLPEFWLACVVVVYIVACAWWASVVLPETASAQWEQAGRWIRLLLFLPFAYFFRRSKDALLWISAFFVFGLVVSTLSVVFDYFVHGKPWPTRFGGHIDKPIVFSFYCVVGLYMVIGQLPRMHEAVSGGWRMVVNGVVAMLIVFLLWAIFSGLSRGVFLTLIVSAMAFSIAWIRYATSMFGLTLFRSAVVALCLLLLSGGVFQSQLAALMDRFDSDSQTYSQMLRESPAELEKIDGSSIRLNMWRFALEEWSQSPVIGRGPGSVEILAERSGIPHLMARGVPFDHLHSAYFQALFCFGLIGVALAFILSAALLLRVVQGWRSSTIDGAVFSAFLAGAVALMMYSLTDFRHLNYDWRAFWWLAAGAALSVGKFRS